MNWGLLTLHTLVSAPEQQYDINASKATSTWHSYTFFPRHSRLGDMEQSWVTWHGMRERSITRWAPQCHHHNVTVTIARLIHKLRLRCDWDLIGTTLSHGASWLQSSKKGIQPCPKATLKWTPVVILPTCSAFRPDRSVRNTANYSCTALVNHHPQMSKEITATN